MTKNETFEMNDWGFQEEGDEEKKKFITTCQ